MKRETNYNNLIRDDLQMIIKEFADIGKTIETEEDFGTYDLWMKRGRRVKRNEKALHTISSKSYPCPVYRAGHQQTDDKGKVKFAKYRQHWCLFSKDQTEKVKGDQNARK